MQNELKVTALAKDQQRVESGDNVELHKFDTANLMSILSINEGHKVVHIDGRTLGEHNGIVSYTRVKYLL